MLLPVLEMPVNQVPIIVAVVVEDIVASILILVRLMSMAVWWTVLMPAWGLLPSAIRLVCNSSRLWFCAFVFSKSLGQGHYHF